MKTCPYCQSALSEDDQFCPFCGQEITAESPSNLISADLEPIEPQQGATSESLLSKEESQMPELREELRWIPPPDPSKIAKQRRRKIKVFAVLLVIVLLAAVGFFVYSRMSGAPQVDNATANVVLTAR